MRLEVEHAFAFEYDGYISESFLELRVQPKTTPTQTVLSFTLAVGPRARVYRYVDWNDNVTHHFTITKFHDRIEVTATSLVETRPAPVALADLGPPAGAGEVPYPLLDYLAFDGPVRLTPALRAAHGALAVPRGAPLDEQVLAMGRALRGRFEYQKDVTRYDSTTEDFLKLGQGVCQDFAHLMLGWLRLSGIPCRYVSGYLHVDAGSASPRRATPGSSSTRRRRAGWRSIRRTAGPSTSATSSSVTAVTTTTCRRTRASIAGRRARRSRPRSTRGSSPARRSRASARTCGRSI